MLCVVVAPIAFGHNLSSSNADFVSLVNGPAVPLFMYLGAKHMITGIDHILYLLALVLLLHKPREVLLLVSLFALGHSLTLVGGVWFSLNVNPGWIDALIGMSIAYKAFENLGGLADFGRWLPPVSAAVFVFGLMHGFGLATKLQSIYSGGDGFLLNLLAFNIGVELGQLIALMFLLGGLYFLRQRVTFARWAQAGSFMLLVCGFAFALYHGVDLQLRNLHG